MPDSGDSTNSGMAKDVREIAVETAAQTGKIDLLAERIAQVHKDNAEMKSMLLAHDNRLNSIGGRVESMESRNQRHDELAAMDRAKRDKRFAFFSKVFWFVVAPPLSMAGVWFFTQLCQMLWRHP